MLFRSGVTGPAQQVNARQRAATVRRLERATGTLATAASARMESDLPWYAAMSAEDRSWVNLVAQAGIAAFVQWFRDPQGAQAITAGADVLRVHDVGPIAQTARMVDAIVRDIEGGIESIIRKFWLNLLQYADDLDADDIVGAIGIRGAMTLARMSPRSEEHTSELQSH